MYCKYQEVKSKCLKSNKKTILLQISYFKKDNIKHDNIKASENTFSKTNRRKK